MQPTEIQTLFARVKPGKIDPRTQTIADIRDADLEFYWKTTATVANTNDAKRQRTPDQRIVRLASARYPAITVDRSGRRLHVFERPTIPVGDNQATAIKRLRGEKI